MSKRLLLVSAVLICGLVSSALSEGSEKDSALILLVKQNYPGAMESIENHLKRYPEDNSALYFKIAIEQTRILDYESYIIDGSRFMKICDSVRQILEGRQKKLRGSDSLDCLFFTANAYGGTSIIHAKTGNWFDAMKDAMSSMSLLKQVKKIDPDYHAAYLGIGVFHYYLRSSLKWLPFVDDKGQEGIRIIENALKAEFPYNYAAKNSLCWILIEKGQFNEADSLAKSVLQDIPDNTIFLRIRSLIALWTGKNRQAIELGLRLVELSERRDPINWSDLIAGHTVLVNSYSNLKMEKESFECAERILNRQITKEYLEIPHIKKNIKYLGEVKQKYKNYALKK